MKGTYSPIKPNMTVFEELPAVLRLLVVSPDPIFGEAELQFQLHPEVVQH